MSKVLVLLISLLSIQANAYTQTRVMCMESNQSAMAITAIIYSATKDSEKTHVMLTKHNADGSTEVSKLEGDEPELSVLSATDSEGSLLTLIESVIVNESGVFVRMLICHSI